MEYTKFKKHQVKKEGNNSIEHTKSRFRILGEQYNGIIQWNTLNVWKFKRKQEGHN
jgi:hypothetical protein